MLNNSQTRKKKMIASREITPPVFIPMRVIVTMMTNVVATMKNIVARMKNIVAMMN
jgi:hypothetical protein